MRIRLKLDVLNIQLKIKGWHICADNEDPYDNWCSIELYLSELMDYNLESAVMTSDEVSELSDLIDRFLNGELNDTVRLDFLEPDFEFVFLPSDSDSDAQWIIHFWSGALSDTFLTIGLEKDDLFALQIYLKLITKQITKSDPIVSEYIEKGILLPEYKWEN